MTNQHSGRILKNEEQIEKLKATLPDWIKNLKRPETQRILREPDPP